MTKKRRLLQSDVMWAAAAVMLVLLQFWWIPGDAGSAADSYSNTVDGKLGLYHVLSQLFPAVKRESESLIPRIRSELLIIGPDRYPSTQEQQQLYSFVTGGGTLVFAPKYADVDVDLTLLGIKTIARPPDAATESLVAIGPPNGSQPPAGATTDSTSEETKSDGKATPVDSVDSDSASENGATGDNSSAPVPATTASAAPPAARSPLALLESPQVTVNSTLTDGTVSFRSNAVVVTQGEDWEKIVTSVSGQTLVAARPVGFGQILVCASPDIFSNRSLLQKDACRLAVRIVERGRTAPHSPIWINSAGPPGIVISEYFNASDSFQSTGILLSPSLRMGTLQMLLVAVLAIWMSFHRFGPAKYVMDSRRRTLTESAQSVGNLQYRLRDGGTIVGNYLEYMNSQLRRRFGSLLRVDDTAALARRSGMEEQEVRENLQKAKELVSRRRVSSAEAARSIRWLSRLMQGLNGIRTGTPTKSAEDTTLM
jgi:hypothetical protein